eukprot:1184174-Prorocentrum_minimum.AAC.1
MMILIFVFAACAVSRFGHRFSPEANWAENCARPHMKSKVMMGGMGWFFHVSRMKWWTCRGEGEHSLSLGHDVLSRCLSSTEARTCARKRGRYTKS